MTVTITEFEDYIEKAYKKRYDESNNQAEETALLMGMAVGLQCEAAELAELVHKENWYNKKYTQQDVASEAGDVLNFLTVILQYHGLTLKDAIENNVDKLIDRKWV